MNARTFRLVLGCLVFVSPGFAQEPAPLERVEHVERAVPRVRALPDRSLRVSPQVPPLPANPQSPPARPPRDGEVRVQPVPMVRQPGGRAAAARPTRRIT